MARTPSGKQYRIWSVIWLLFCATLLPGCEVGNTMFQYSSGGTPWMGINLIPKKKSVSTISHEVEPAPASKTNAVQNLAQQEKPLMKNFQKKPLRLELPSSRDELQATELSQNIPEEFPAASFADRQF